ncbi:MAG: hypothetical protein F6K42_15310 [Leptolyngbya sp. SIO1D8]|nr:hypothetical protein [Leptolyngbya sp. SIO1D8]
MNDPVSLQVNLTTLSAIGAAAWFLWSRYQALEQRLKEFDKRITQAEHLQELARQGTISNYDQLTYQVNANRELIGHRTERFTGGLKAVEERLSRTMQETFARLDGDMKDLKSFLEQNTAFRSRREDPREL